MMVEAGPHESGWVLAVVSGEVDLSTAPRLREALVEAVDRHGRRLVVDLGAVDLLDSTGLGVLAGLLRRTVGRGGRMVLVVPPGPVANVLSVTGLDRAFEVRSTLVEVFRRESGARHAGLPSSE